MNIWLLGLPVYCAVAARMAGGGICKHKPGTGEALFTLPIAYAFYERFNFSVFYNLFKEPFKYINIDLADYSLTSLWVCTILSAVWTFLWFQTGYAIAFHMGRDKEMFQKNKRKNVLYYVVALICRLFNVELYSPAFCWIMMGLKGLLMGAFLFPHGVLYALLFPTAYWIGNRYIYIHYPTIDGEVVSESMSGFFMGLLIVWSLI